ncbi:MAG: ATPase [Nitrospirota bacterium]
MILLDAGTSYSKILNTEDETIEIIPTKELPAGCISDIATGHNITNRTKKGVNELIALTRGSLNIVNNEDNFAVVDIGSRDIKYIKIRDRRYEGSDWNTSCGAFSGFTIEMLGRHYNIDFTNINPSETEMPVTCGLFGMSYMFDMIGRGYAPEDAISYLIKGIVMGIYRFAQSPERLYLSGGLCNNNLVINSFPCEVIPLGRFALLEGLKVYTEEEITYTS